MTSPDPSQWKPLVVRDKRGKIVHETQVSPDGKFATPFVSLGGEYTFDMPTRPDFGDSLEEIADEQFSSSTKAVAGYSLQLEREVEGVIAANQALRADHERIEREQDSLGDQVDRLRIALEKIADMDDMPGYTGFPTLQGDIARAALLPTDSEPGRHLGRTTTSPPPGSENDPPLDDPLGHGIAPIVWKNLTHREEHSDRCDCPFCQP